MNHFTSFMKATLALSAGLCVFAGGLNAQAARDSRPVLGAGAQTADAQAAKVLTAGATLPLRRIMLFSSGIAYYEHSGALNGGALLTIPFKAGAINDALKSLVLNDPASANPSVSYQSEQTLPQTLRSLKIDLSDEPDTALILSRLRGAEVEIAAPVAVSGRILGIEYRSLNVSTGDIAAEPWLSLYTAEGLRLFNLKEISSLRFKDPQLNEDLGRALDMIMDFRNSDTRNLLVSLPGGASRQVSLSYVIPSPVWKVSYRLDLAAISGASAAPAPFQGWAIVDNDSDNDWENVELSLVAGRPASFIQQLYPPYYLARPTLPLAIAGTAGAAAHDAGYAASAQAPAPEAARQKSAARSTYMAAEPLEYAVMDDAVAAAPAQNLSGGAIAGAQGSAAGDQFEFTVKTPVSLERRMSAMLPLVATTINGRKLLIFSGAGAQGSSVHPRLGAEIINTTGMKLPAGPITVYDGGTYAGDALIEFWNENEKRLISFGEDLAVSGTVMNSSARAVTAVNVAGGVMTISRSQSYLKTYTFKNAASQSKQLVVEHQKTPGTSLQSPAADEQTPSLYRFTMTLPAAGSELILMVTETRPVSEQISLLSLRPESLLTYVTNQEIPPQVRAALQRAVDLRQAVISAETAVAGKESQRASLVTDQDRIRKNLEAAGSQTQQGQEYLKRLVSLDNEISAVAPELEQARASAKDAQKAYEDYLITLNL